ncbi:hypothetical protein CYLTODRAFT_445200 [Cylindrobasidium torrendii FP15055 ss-10]|uniref:Uncharacterized protein n=1 Tax=Cylindrobasidium torrendii FP15055 ss-10 TaxID=1314674 RepID=A0A0D7B658_9AGAR|nr:hypothetical protein CYLTODRAFT_445200 [Cylindrobasidium torrendii FP15055 ss-10]
MPPKTHRTTSTGALRSHSRSSSATRLGPNLQLTTTATKGVDKTKKEAHGRLPRVHSSSRIDLRAETQKRAAQPPAAPAKTNGSKLKGGFKINYDDDEEDDAWVSSESANETSQRYDESDTDSDSGTTTAATPVARDVSMRPPRIAKRSSSNGSTRRPTIQRTDSMRSVTSKRSANTDSKPKQQQAPPPPPLTNVKGPPSPISPSTNDTSAAISTTPQAAAIRPSAPAQAYPSHPIHQSPEMMQESPEKERGEIDFPNVKFNGPVNHRLPAPGQFLEAQSRRGGIRGPPHRSLTDVRLMKPMEPMAAAGFAHAVASQDQDPAEIAAALSKPSSPTLRNDLQMSKPSPPGPPQSAVPRSKQFDANISDHRRHSSAVVSGASTPESGSSRKKTTHSRPSSVHSLNSTSKHLRPHPLIRGQTNGGAAPLQPLTVRADEPKAQLSNSPSIEEFPPSPQSASTSSSAYSQFPRLDGSRRSSISSARSVSTLPVPPVTTKDHRKNDRSRTLSTISSSSTIAALSSLIQQPVAPSQRITYFPQIEEEDIKKIHPLPPVHLTHNHLQYTARRSPLRESYERLMRAKALAGRT